MISFFQIKIKGKKRALFKERTGDLFAEGVTGIKDSGFHVVKFDGTDAAFN